MKINELKLAAHIACHSCFKTVDHLGVVVKEISGKKISLHRTKCTTLINRVVGSWMVKTLCNVNNDREH